MSEVRLGLPQSVKHLQLLIRQTADAELAVVGLSLAQYAVLRELHVQPGASASELARRCYITRQAVQFVLATLLARGLVVDAEPVAGRARPVTSTAAGERSRRAGKAVMTRIEERMLDGLSSAQRATLDRLVKRCVENLR